MKTKNSAKRWLGLALACGIIAFAARAPAQRPVILSFQPNGLLTWSNAYPDAVASVERLADVVATGSVVTVSETLGVSDGSTLVYNHTVAHPPIASPSVTISDGTYSWNDQTGSSSPPNFLGTVGSYASGQVTAIYLITPSTSGTVIQVEYSYLPLSTNQEWLSVYSAQATSQAMRVTVDMSDDSGLFRIVNRPGPMALIPGGNNNGTNPLGTYDSPQRQEQHDPCRYPASYSLTVSSFLMNRYEVTNDEMVEALQWAYDHGLLLVSSTTVRNAEGDKQELLDLASTICRISWDGSSFKIKSVKGAGYPCLEVSWYGAVAYCNYLSQKEGLTPCYNLSDWRCNLGANGYRLPSNEEWEYAARGGLVSKRFPWGDTISYSEANYYSVPSFSYDLGSGGPHPLYYTGDADLPDTSPVGTFAPNAYGLYDMAGNVREWCNDYHPCGSYYVLRGGSYWSDPVYCRVGDIYWTSAPYYAYYDYGFRVVRGVSL